MIELVVNVYKTKDFDVFIGREKFGMHFGNPFSHLDVFGIMKMASREDAVIAFKKWLSGSAHKDIEQERRKWILENICSLNGKRFGCFCAPKLCHGHILALLAESC